MHAIRVFVLLAAACGLAAGAGATPQSQTVLGAEGEVFTVRAGSEAALLGIGSEEPVLVLDVASPDGARQRYLVPGTDGGEPEGHPFLLLDSETRTLYLLWESVINSLHPILNLVSFQDSLWGEHTQIVYNAFSPKTSPQMLVHHDDVRELEVDGNLTTRRRTIVHVAWTEEDETSGAVSTFYAPLVFDKDVYMHSSAVRLNDLLPAGATAAPAERTLSGLKLQIGSDQRRVTVAFPTETGDRLGVVELDLLPGDLGRLAEEARGHIIDFGARYESLTPDALRSIADEARGHIIDFGVAFHPEIVRAIAEEARGHIIDFGARVGSGGPDDIRSIAAAARGHIIDFGSKMAERGLRRVSLGSTSTLLEVAIGAEGESSSPVLIQVKPLSTYPAPDLGGVATHTFLSPGGQDVVLARAADDRVVYRQLRGDEWSPLFELKLTESFDLDAALRVLADRVDGR